MLHNQQFHYVAHSQGLSQPHHIQYRPPLQQDSSLFEDSPTTPNKYDLERKPSFPRKLQQSDEESPQIIMTTSDGLERQQKLDEDDEREGENDIEFIIMNLYSKMKNLESKYIDLANFYKQELVKTSNTKKNNNDEHPHFRDTQYANSKNNPMQGVTPSRSFDRSQEINIRTEQSPGKVSSYRAGDVPSEGEIIRDLIEEKKKEQIQNLNDALKQSLSDIANEVDYATTQELQAVTQKQNEMYNLIQKYNLSSTLKNESLGLWYDVKTKISNIMSELKIKIAKQSKNQSTSIAKEKGTKQNKSQDESYMVIQGLSILVNDFKNKQEKYNSSFQNMINQIKFKEGMILDEQQKAQNFLKEIISDLSSSEISKRKDQLLLSGEKQSIQPNVMSPFEKRLATYQKSAEMRKSGDNFYRSGSKGRQGYPNVGTQFNFYQSRELQNPQILQNQYQQNESNNSDDFRYFKSKLRTLDFQFQDLIVKMANKQKQNEELDKLFQRIISNQEKFFKQSQKKLTENNQNQKSQGISVDQRSRSRDILSRQDNKIQNLSSSIENKPSQYSSQRVQLQEKKITELQKNNDQLFIELRKTNEKYLNLKIENNKFKDEIQVLQNALEESNIEIKKQQHQSFEQPYQSKQQIKKKVSSSNRVPQQQLPQNSQLNTTIYKENEDLKRRLKDLESELVNLNYQFQDVQRKGLSHTNEAAFRSLTSENQENKSKVDLMCISVQKFLLSMKRLQRAVNNKDRDIQIYKTEFEQNKKSLELLVKDTKEQLQQNQYSQNRLINNSLYGQLNQNQNHHSMVTSWDKRDQKFSNNKDTMEAPENPRNKSVGPYQKITALQNNQQNQLNSKTQRTDSQDNIVIQKKGIIRPKQNQQNSQPFQGFNDVSSIEQEQYMAQEVQSPAQENQFNKLIEEVTQLQQVNESYKQQIEELKTHNEQIMADKNQLDIKYNTKSINLQKITQQLKSSSEKIEMSDILITDYKRAVVQLEQSSNLNRNHISKIKADLLIKERDLIHSQLQKKDSGRVDDQQKNEQQQNLEHQLALQSQINKAQIDMLKDELVQAIKRKEEELEQQYENLVVRVNSKEQDIDYLKKLLVEKLKEIESSFVEISQEIQENEQIQQEVSKRFVQQTQVQLSQYNQQKSSDLEKSIEQVISKYDDDQRDEDLQKLVQDNEELITMNSELTKKVKDLEQQVVQVQKSKQNDKQLEKLQQENEVLSSDIQIFKEQLEKKQKQIDTNNLAMKKLNSNLHESQAIRERVELNYQRQLNELEEQLQEGKYELAQEQEKRVLYESEYNMLEKQSKTLKSEYKAIEHENEQLKKREQSLMAQIENIYQEKDYLSGFQNTVKDKDNNSSRDDVQDNNNSGNKGEKFVDDIENAKIETNPKETAQSYLRMLKVTSKEYSILQKSQDKVMIKFNEEKEKYVQLKQESRQSFEQILNMETKIFELESENEKLIAQLSSIKGDYKVDEENLRSQFDNEYKNRLDYKDSEIEALNIKLQRISQNLIDLSQKSSRLESANSDLSIENEQIKNRLQSLEMELEMTKQTSERDTEHLLEQQRQEALLDKIKMESDKVKQEVILNEKLKLVEQERIQLEDKISKKKQKMQGLKKEKEDIQKSHQGLNFMQESIKKSFEQKLDEMRQRLEEEKKAREETENKKKQMVKEQEQEKEKLIKQQESEKDIIQKQFQQQIESEKVKNQGLEQQKHQKEKELNERHKNELERLEKQLQDERLQQESNLKQSEQQKIEQIKKNLESEKQRLLVQKEQEKQDLLQEQQEQNERELNLIQQQHDQELKQLRAIKDKEALMIESKLKSEVESVQKMSKKSMSLIAVLQNKARQVILQELENEKIKRQEEKLQQKQEIDQLVMKQENVMKQIENKKTSEINQIKTQFEEQKNGNEHEKNKLQQELIQKIEQIQKQNEKEVDKQKKEYDKLKAQQQELLHNLTEQQDQQTQELLEQKEQEKNEAIQSLNKEINKHRKEIQQFQDTILKNKKEFQSQIHEFREEISVLQDQIQTIQLDKDKQLKSKDHDLKKLREENKIFLEESQHQTQKDLEQLKLHLEEKHTSLLKKKEGERSLLEKMQEKIREDLKSQIEEKEQENREKQKQIKQLEIDSNTKDKTFEKERIDMQELIDQMNISMRQIGEQKVLLDKENEKIKKELDILKKQSHESENSLIKDLREKLSQKDKQCEELLQEKGKKEQELASLKSQLKSRENDIHNLEKDLEQFGKEMEDERVSNEYNVEQVNQRIKEVQEQKELAIKEKKEINLQMKMKEGLLTRLQEQLQEKDQILNEQQQELDELAQEQSQSQRDKQNNNVSENITKLLSEFESKLGSSEQYIYQNKKLTEQVDKYSKLCQRLQDTSKQEKPEEIQEDILSGQLKYCKRVKYLNKAWILTSKNNQEYLWIEQDSIPIQQLSSIQQLDTEESEGQFQERLDYLQKQKETFLQILKSQKGYQSQNIFEIEKQEIKQQYTELQIQYNNLEQYNTQLKQKINELNEKIYGLNDTENLNTILELHNKNKELTSKLVVQYDTSRKLEQELEIKVNESENLKKQIQESENSFMRIGGGQSIIRAENFPLEASSIEEQVEDDDDYSAQNIPNQIQVKVQRLETEMEEYQKIKNELEQQNVSLKQEVRDLKQQSSLGQNQVHEAEIQEQLKHIRSILIKFLEKIPVGPPENESMLSIVYSMMHFTPEEKASLQKARQSTSEQALKQATKKGVFSMFGKKDGGK